MEKWKNYHCDARPPSPPCAGFLLADAGVTAHPGLKPLRFTSLSAARKRLHPALTCWVFLPVHPVMIGVSNLRHRVTINHTVSKLQQRETQKLLTVFLMVLFETSFQESSIHAGCSLVCDSCRGPNHL